MSLSSITVSGKLKKDPEKRFTPSNIPVTNLTLEISYLPRSSELTPGGISSQIVRVNAWRDLAEECERKLKAGDKILVIGKVQINAYVSQDGKKKREIEIDANSVTKISDVLSIQLPEKKNESEKTAKVVNNVKTEKENTDVEQISNFEEVINTTEEIPF